MHFKIGDRVCVSPSTSESLGTAVDIRKPPRGDPRLQECHVDFGTHRLWIISRDLEGVAESGRLQCRYRDHT
jgi:hypothetical protein